MRTLFAVPALIVIGIVAACDADRSPAAVAPLADVIVEEVEKMVLAEEVVLIDKDADGNVCVKPTPSDHLVLKEANPTASQPCPPAFSFKGKGSVIKWQKEWDVEDVNRNGVVCAKQTANGSWVVKDDNEATPSQPCPPAFYIAGASKPVHKVPSDDLAAADDNRNGVVCLNVVEATGNFLIHDDSEATPSQPCAPPFYAETTGAIIIIEK